jgi:hypothetical protein
MKILVKEKEINKITLTEKKKKKLSMKEKLILPTKMNFLKIFNFWVNSLTKATFFQPLYYKMNP